MNTYEFKKHHNSQNYLIVVAVSNNRSHASLYWGHVADSMPVCTRAYSTGNANKASHAIWTDYQNQIKKALNERAFKKANK